MTIFEYFGRFFPTLRENKWKEMIFNSKMRNMKTSKLQENKLQETRKENY